MNGSLHNLDELDRERLTELLLSRNRLDLLDPQRAYLRGRIDEYCDQNAVDVRDLRALDRSLCSCRARDRVRS